MKIGCKVLYGLFYTFLILTFLGGICGVIYELLPNRSFIPDPLFSAVFYSQFVIIPGLLITAFLIKKLKK